MSLNHPPFCQMTWLLVCHMLVLMLVSGNVASQLCIINNSATVDYSRRTLSIVSFDNRGASFSQTKLRGFGRRFGRGLQDIVVLGKNCSWKPLQVN